MKLVKRVYKDFNDYWSNGNHGMSSCSRDWIKEIWDNLEPTINANKTDYERLLIQEALDQKERYCEQLREMHEYLKEFNLEEKAGIKFFRWLLDKNHE